MRKQLVITFCCFLFLKTAISQPISDCSSFNARDCNGYIQNNQFTLTGPATDAQFGLGQVADWYAAHGTPDVDPTPCSSILPPAGANHWAYMFAESENTSTGSPARAEAIYQKIAPLKAGDTYMLNYFVRLIGCGSIHGPKVDKLQIILMHCSDANIFTGGNSYSYPQVPSNSQIITTQTNINNSSNWSQEFVCFTPNDDYDLIYIVPFNDPANSFNITALGIALPEITLLSAFSAGPIPVPTPANGCRVMIGPDPGNCAYNNAQFWWLSPTGQLIQALPGTQQLMVDAATQSGTWTLIMVPPQRNPLAPGTCGLSATVYVPNCYCPLYISPGGPVDYHYLWEAGTGKYTFTSSVATGNQWWVNNRQVPGATGQTFEYVFSGGTSNETHLIKVTNSNGCTSNTVEFNLRPYGLCSIPPNTYNNHCWPSGINTPRYYCRGSSSTMSTFNMGSNATYSWTITGNGTPNGPLTFTGSSQHQATVDVSPTAADFEEAMIYAVSALGETVKVFDYYPVISPGSLYGGSGCASNNIAQTWVGTSGFDNEYHDFSPGVIISPSQYAGLSQLPIGGINNQTAIYFNRNGSTSYTSTFTNNNYNDCRQVTRLLNIVSYCRTSDMLTDGQTAETTVSVYPNPAREQVTVKASKGLIQYVEITDMFNLTVRTIKTASSPLINIQLNGLKAGYYNLRVVSSAGVENKKIRIVN